MPPTLRSATKHRYRRIVAIIGGLALAGTGAATAAAVRASHSTPARTDAPARTFDVTCRAPAMGRRLPARVYLPPGYTGGTARYPVVYFLHGLPADPTTYKSFAFVAGAVARSGHSAIVVSPQGAQTAGADREYLDWSPTEDWPRAITHDLPHCIAARFRTLSGRRGRALVGLSAGGFGAFNIGLRALDRFAAVESWSGYFYATDPSGLHKLELGTPDADDAAAVPPPARIKRALRRHPTFVGFYVGRSDTRFLQPNLALDREFARNDIAHVFRVYPGGHTVALWADEAPRWLGMALANLAAPR